MLCIDPGRKSIRHRILFDKMSLFMTIGTIIDFKLVFKVQDVLFWNSSDPLSCVVIFNRMINLYQNETNEGLRPL